METLKLDRVPPQDVDAERAVLGSMLTGDMDIIDRVVRIFNSNGKEVFYLIAHQKIYNAILGLYEKNTPADIVTVTEELQRNNDIANIDPAYIDEMIDSIPTTANVEHYAKIVQEEYNKRALIRIATELYNRSFDFSYDSDTLFEDAWTELEKIKSILPIRTERIIETASQFLAREKSRTPYIIDKILPESGFTTIAGYTGQGKTTLTMQMILSILSGISFLNTFQISKNDYHILYINLENSEYTIDKMLKCQLTEFQTNKEMIDRLFIPNCMAMSLDNAKDKRAIRSWIESSHIEVVVIDPVLDSFTGDQNDLTVVRNLIKTMREIEGNISWVLLHHFKKGTEEDDLIKLMLGSIGFANAMTSIIGLRRYSSSVNPLYKKVEFGKARDFEAPESITVYMNPQTRIFEIVADAGEMKPVSEDYVVHVLKTQGSQTYTNLVTIVEMSLGLAERQAKYLISRALANHKIKVNNGLYQIGTKQLIPNYLDQTKKDINTDE